MGVLAYTSFIVGSAFYFGGMGAGILYLGCAVAFFTYSYYTCR